MSEPFIAQITMFGGNFAPRGWAYCDGQLMSIAQNTALFSLVGTTYGGDGRTTFGLPDMRGRTPIHPGTGPGLSTRRLGQRSGLETTTSSIQTMANHSHAVQGGGLKASSAAATSAEPVNGAVLSKTSAGLGAGDKIYGTGTQDVDLGGGAVTLANTGGQQAHNNMQPFLAIHFIIAMQGIFPSRS